MSNDQEDYEQEWQELDEKVIMAQMLSELQQIRLLLQDSQEPQDTSHAMFECQRCSATVKPEDRERHALSKHKAPADMIDSLFTKV